jgi:hypothetical protein
MMLSNMGMAQERFTISGSVTDATSGEELLGASDWITELGLGGFILKD